ncbi:MAG: CopG family transcriptional regulator [Firmicutes bacterium HGW-Firmicutes-1]|jgi:putative iron-only hydrogenase system regulator|nr:MAG: CopG family transcriptional regulator [Firmicutes bacterium HGW-Firmicutes-1]
METRIGVIGIVVEKLEETAQINEVLHQYADIIVGRMGMPYKQKGISVISLIIDGSTDEIGSLTGKLGNIEGVNVKSALSKKTY